jgi:hypothetical protein
MFYKIQEMSSSSGGSITFSRAFVAWRQAMEHLALTAVLSAHANSE